MVSLCVCVSETLYYNVGYATVRCLFSHNILNRLSWNRPPTKF